MEENRKRLAAVRIRGLTNVKGEIQETLRMLLLNHSCHAVLIDNRPSYIGMLKKAGNHITWGEVSKDTISMLLRKRGRTIGNKRLTDQYAERVGYGSLDELAEAIWKMEVDYRDLPEIEPIFRLHPPRKGFRGGVKRSYSAGGASGYRGETINDFLEKMA